jgi:hypothetical protein
MLHEAHRLPLWLIFELGRKSMSFLDSVIGISKKKLQPGVLDEMRFDAKGVRGRLMRLPCYFASSNPEQKMQSTDFALQFAEALTNHQPVGEERLFDSLAPFREYSFDLHLDGETTILLEFRIDRGGASDELFSALIAVIDDAFQSSHLTFVALRK